MRKNITAALVLTAILAAAQPALAAKSQPRKSSQVTAPAAPQRDGDLLRAFKQIVKKFFGTTANEQIVLPRP